MSFLPKSNDDAANAEPPITFDIPKECKAGVCRNEGPNYELKVEMVPVPEPGPDELLLKLNATGICMSDVHWLLNDLVPIPMSYFGVHSPGHEGAGVVVKLGANVKNWKVGDRAGVKPLMDVCMSCEQCLTGRDNYCAGCVHTGLMATGTYQQYIVSPARYTTRIPEGIPDYVAAPIMCSASTMVRSLEESELRPGNWAVFPGGGGGVGIQGVQLARAMGFRPIVIDTGDAKKKLAMEMGAEAFVDFKTSEDVAKDVIAIADGVGGHGVFVTAPAGYVSAVSLTGERIGAKVMCIGIPPGDSEFILGAKPTQFINKNLSVKGTQVGSLQDTIKALDYAKRGMLKQICTVYPVDQLPQAVADLRAGKIAGRAVVDFNQ